MNIRESMEQREQKMLSPYAALSLCSRGRERQEEECDVRTVYQRDRDRIGASTLARNKNYYKPQKCGLFYVKFYLFLCCTELYFIFICDIMRYETQL